MKETKVYVDELPKCCWDCPCYDMYELQCQINYADCENIDATEERHKYCKLKTIQDHDRELVKEVCEKIKNWGNKHFNWVGDGTGYDGQDYNEMIGFNNAIKQLNEFLDQIQKEFEK